MNPFLNPGLEFLFRERIKRNAAANPKYSESELEIVLACPGALHPGASFKTAPPPNSLAAKLISTLTDTNRQILTYAGSGRLQTPNTGKSGTGGIICYEDFASFIRSEL
jgi:hypothetical protein